MAGGRHPGATAMPCARGPLGATVGRLLVYEPFLASHPLVLLSVQAILVIAASRVLALVLRRLGQPLVIAEVLAGIGLGPSLLGALAPETFAVLFPDSSLGTLGVLSQLGLVFFMFIIRLELEPQLLRGLGKRALLISNTSIAVPFALGVGVALWLAPTWSLPGVPLSHFALFLGVAMSVTAFPVLARILSERGLLHTRIGALASRAPRRATSPPGACRRSSRRW
jgi:Kef-type K+ transport system membrane component KefB